MHISRSKLASQTVLAPGFCSIHRCANDGVFAECAPDFDAPAGTSASISGLLTPARRAPAG